MPRYTPEQLRTEAEDWESFGDGSSSNAEQVAMLRQAADDAETLATLTREMRDWCDDVDTSQPIDRICKWLDRLEAKLAVFGPQEP